MAFPLLWIHSVRCASAVLLLALMPVRGHAQGASAHPHEQAQAPIPTPLRQAFRTCRIWEYDGPDSTQRVLRLRQRFNAQGWLVEEVRYAGRGARLRVITTDRAYYHGGRLTKQIQWRLRGQPGDQKLRSAFSYNRHGQLVREVTIRFKHQIKRGLVRGRGSGGPDLIALSDLERRRRQEMLEDIHYAYSPQGQPVERVDVMPAQADQNRETWAYDSLGRLARHASFGGGQLLWVEYSRYTTVAGGSRCDQTWSSTDALPGPAEALNPDVTPPHTVTTYFDEQHRAVRQVSVHEPGQEAEVVLTTYDAEGRLHHVQTLNATGGPRKTVVYSYP